MRCHYIITLDSVYGDGLLDEVSDDRVEFRDRYIANLHEISKEYSGRPLYLSMKITSLSPSVPLYYYDGEHELWSIGKRYVEIDPSIKMQNLMTWADENEQEHVIYDGCVLEVIDSNGMRSICTNNKSKHKKPKKPSKAEQVKNYLVTNGFITSWGAIEMFRATRLSAIIFNLRKRGWVIESRYKENNGTRYVEYVLVEKGR